MTSKLTRERIELIANFHRAMTLPPSHDEIEELARMALAAMDSEPAAPVAEIVSIYGDPEAFGEREIRPLVGIQQMPYGTKLYRHAQPAPERDQVRSEHAEWSQTTFGNVGPIGPLKHLSKEALEAAAEPGDLSEWADMQFLLWDAQRRAGITDEQITQAMIDKLAVNKQREWPEPKDGEPRLHIKAQPAPVVPDESYQQLSDLYHAQEKRLFKIAQRIKGSAFDKYSHSPSQAIDVLEAAIFGDNDACRAAMLQAQSEDDDGEPTDDERIMAIEGIHNCERCGDEGWIVGEMGITSCACGQAGTLINEGTIQAGNSPVITGAEQRIADAVELLQKAAPAMLADNSGPDGPLAGRLKSPVIPDGSAYMLRRWLAFGRGMQNAGSQLPHNLIAETESMLAAAPKPQNSPQNIPEIIPGWIPVSERMPETDGNYWGWWSESKRQGPVWFIKSELQAQFQSHEITHWMPLPAAPQEVKGE